MEENGGESHSAVDYDFDGVEQQDFESVPPGTYLCRVEEARPGVTRSGHPRWALKFVIHDGPESGRIAAWDGLVFSPKAAARTQQVLAALGLPHEGRVQIEPSSLVGRIAFVTVTTGVWRNPVTGITTRRNTVPYGGVHPAEGQQPPAAGDAEIPF